MNANLLATLLTLLAVAAIASGLLDRDLFALIITNFLAFLAGSKIEQKKGQSNDTKIGNSGS